ncbi:MAG: class I SAM-dependent methyltransferase [Dissulfurispiraceae bacterium]
METADIEYLMEHPEEALRLDVKTNTDQVIKQAQWAGIGPGMRVADVGCGSGKTTFILHGMVQPGGSVVGIDGSQQRIHYAQKKYSSEGIEYIKRDLHEPLDDLGKFDAVWVRFFLEYYRAEAFDLVRNISQLVKPNGTLCLIDLDRNCLNLYGISDRLMRTILQAVQILEEEKNFDPYMGAKLFGFLAELGYEDLAYDVSAHHFIYGELKDADAYNWFKKMEVVALKTNCSFGEYENGYEGFKKEFYEYMTNPKRFIYTPVICAKGRKPVEYQTP